MHLWLLRPIYTTKPREKNPWNFPLHKMHGFVVRAEDETEARHLANRASAKETTGWMTRHAHYMVRPWLDEALTTCERLTEEGPEQVIIRDYWRG